MDREVGDRKVHGRPCSRSGTNVSLVGARGFEPPGPTTRIIVPTHIAEALRVVA